MKTLLFTAIFLTVSGDIAQGTNAPSPRIHTSAVTLRALDKITARVTQLDVPIAETITFGTLEITARHCAKNPPEDPPESAAFLDIREKKETEMPSPIFSGWMFSSAPAVSAMEHPVYDVWVVSCSGNARVPVLTDDGDDARVSTPDNGDDRTPPPSGRLSDDSALDGFLDGFSDHRP